jgi:hypothetical protein
MTPEEYRSICGAKEKAVFPSDIQKLSAFSLKPRTVDFLKIGLPKQVAPYVSFNRGDELLNRIETLNRIYKIEDEFQKYVVIGADGSGNPVAINTANNDIVEWLDHEDYFAASYFNASIEAMLQFFLIYEDFLETILLENGEDAVVNSNFTDEQFLDMKNKMLFVDAKAVNERGFWKEELEMELANREYYSSQG